MSTTVTVKLAVAAFPAVSMAVYVTVVTPGGKLAPDATVEVKLATATLSEAVGEDHVAMVAPPGDGVSVMLTGTFAIAGGTLSTTVTAKLVVDVLPAASRAV